MRCSMGSRVREARLLFVALQLVAVASRLQTMLPSSIGFASFQFLDPRGQQEL